MCTFQKLALAAVALRHTNAGVTSDFQRPRRARDLAAHEWAAVVDGNGETDAAPPAWKKDVGVGGWGGHPVLGMKGEVVDRRE